MKTFEIKTKIMKINGTVNFLVVSINGLEYTIAITGNINRWYELHHYDEDNTVFDINQYYDNDNNLNVVVINNNSGHGYKFHKVGNEFQLATVIN